MKPTSSIDAIARKIGQIFEQACVLEVTAPKPGNVHARASFEDMAWEDFVASAAVSRSPLESLAGSTLAHPDQPPAVGQAIERAVTLTREAVGVNTNLGLLLLAGPLTAGAAKAASPSLVLPLNPGALRDATRLVLDNLTMDDARATYRAIQTAAPGGLGDAPQGDVRDADQPPPRLQDAMAWAAHRDAIASEYVTGMALLFERIHPDLQACLDAGLAVDDAVVLTFVRQLARAGDTLIARKLGPDASLTARNAARQALNLPLAGEAPSTPQSLEQPPTDPAPLDESRLAELDHRLRDPDHRWNPGTTADLIGAGLYVAGLCGTLNEPFAWRTSMLDPALSLDDATSSPGDAVD